MGEYIDKQATIADLNGTYDKMAAFHPQFYSGYQFAVNRIRTCPAADVEPVRHGKWLHNDKYVLWAERYICSLCGRNAPTDGDYRQKLTDYCPNCGARMDGGANNG